MIRLSDDFDPFDDDQSNVDMGYNEGCDEDFTPVSPSAILPVELDGYTSTDAENPLMVALHNGGRVETVMADDMDEVERIIDERKPDYCVVSMPLKIYRRHVG